MIEEGTIFQFQAFVTRQGYVPSIAKFFTVSKEIQILCKHFISYSHVCMYIHKRQRELVWKLDLSRGLQCAHPALAVL